jgi:hypothetical protein
LFTFLSSPIRATCPAHLIRFNLGMSTNYEAPHCATSSILLSPHPSLVQIFLSEPCSQTPSTSALPLTWKTKFHNIVHTTINMATVRFEKIKVTSVVRICRPAYENYSQKCITVVYLPIYNFYKSLNIYIEAFVGNYASTTVFVTSCLFELAVHFNP